MHPATSPWTARLLITISILFVFLMLVMPLISILSEALGAGWQVYLRAISDTYAMKALELTLTATILAVIINSIFGLFAAWALTRYSFPGKNLLVTLIDIPFAVSPVIAGLIFILTFGRLGWLNSFLTEFDIKIVFATPGVVLATIFVTFPFVARELIPLLEARGTDEEQAAALMGAKAFTIFRKITFPHIRWALLYSVILCTARAMGEFGAVSVVSGHLRGKTNTLPLHIEILYNEFQFRSAFAVASLLVVAAIILLIARNIVELLVKKESDPYVR